jgi:hypothetical protein
MSHRSPAAAVAWPSCEPSPFGLTSPAPVASDPSGAKASGLEVPVVASAPPMVKPLAPSSCVLASATSAPAVPPESPVSRLDDPHAPQTASSTHGAALVADTGRIAARFTLVVLPLPETLTLALRLRPNPGSQRPSSNCSHYRSRSRYLNCRRYSNRRCCSNRYPIRLHCPTRRIDTRVTSGDSGNRSTHRSIRSCPRSKSRGHSSCRSRHSNRYWSRTPLGESRSSSTRPLHSSHHSTTSLTTRKARRCSPCKHWPDRFVPFECNRRMRTRSSRRRCRAARSGTCRSGRSSHSSRFGNCNRPSGWTSHRCPRMVC